MMDGLPAAWVPRESRNENRSCPLEPRIRCCSRSVNNREWILFRERSARLMISIVAGPEPSSKLCTATRRSPMAAEATNLPLRMCSFRRKTEAIQSRGKIQNCTWCGDERKAIAMITRKTVRPLYLAHRTAILSNQMQPVSEKEKKSSD